MKATVSGVLEDLKFKDLYIFVENLKTKLMDRETDDTDFQLIIEYRATRIMFLCQNKMLNE